MSKVTKDAICQQHIIDYEHNMHKLYTNNDEDSSRRILPKNFLKRFAYSFSLLLQNGANSNIEAFNKSLVDR